MKKISTLNFKQFAEITNPNSVRPIPFSLKLFGALRVLRRRQFTVFSDFIYLCVFVMTAVFLLPAHGSAQNQDIVNVMVAEPSIIETGEITVDQQNKDQWHQVDLTNTFTSPVVVMGPPSYNGSQPTTIRVRHVTSNSFEFQIDEWNYLDGNHIPESISYMVLEEGVHQIGDLKVQASSNLMADHNWTKINFAQPFNEPPVVISQCGSYYGSHATTTRIANVSTNSFELRLVEEEANDGEHTLEEIHYIAIEPGSSGTGLFASKTIDPVDHQWYMIDFSNFSGNLVNPTFFGAIQTFDGVDPCTLRYQNLNPANVQIMIEEETSSDKEVAHLPEEVGFIVYDPGECITLYEHGDYQGQSWELCGLGKYTALSDFGDNIISSIKIPEGLSVTACDEADVNYNCRVFSEDVPRLWETSALNDKISALNINNNDRFSMVVMGDPQLWWSCHYEGCQERCDNQETGCYDGNISNLQQIVSIRKTVIDQVKIKNFEGIVINGDLTAFGHKEQLNQFEAYYYGSGLRIFPGFGNHDYQNNVDDCFDNDCAFRMINWLEQKVGQLKDEGAVWAFDLERKGRDHYGILAYAWSTSDYVFVQLNNHSGYEVEFKDNVHWEEAYIYNSYTFLEMCLRHAMLQNKKVVINQHIETFSDRFKKILSNYNNVVAVFVGHKHERVGFWSRILLENNTKIPVFYSGSPGYARYLLVDFGSKDIIVNTVNSQSQDFDVIDSYKITVE
jgi:cytolysin (calcineurin-like family phosphatase)